MQQGYEIHLTPIEERLGQILTRNAWTYFNDLISTREVFQVKEIPMMPRGGVLLLPQDLEIAQYYVDEAPAAAAQLTIYGYQDDEAEAAAVTFTEKVCAATGIHPGLTDQESASA
jgi:hypothetical protein